MRTAILAVVRLAFAHAVALSFVGIASAGPWDAPADYYDSATGTGATLKSQLHDIIDGHTVRSYGDARSILQVTDRDPNDPNRMLLVYDRVSLNVSSINPGGSIPGWDSGNSWNREHTWPRSRGIDSSGADNSDLHQLRPSDPGVNTSRGNKNFGGDYGSPFGAVSGTDLWYPGDADAAMIARQMFYVAVRYDGSDSATNDLELAAGDTSQSNRLGDIDALIDWHYRAAPDDFERRRNDVIFDDYQGNRNPFVDHPEFVWSVFVDQQNDTQLSIAGESVSLDGSSTSFVDLGRVYVGGASPADQTVTVEKAGVDGTYYSVTAGGDATTDAGEYARPLALGAGVTDSFEVGLDVSTANSGAFGGFVTIDNLDVTTAGGPGRGANDANDLIGLSFTVLNQPVASFSAGGIVADLKIDFGAVDLGSGLLTESLDLFNYDGLGGPTMASDLDVDLVSGSGDDLNGLSIDLGTSAGLTQGGGLSFDALFDTSVAGSFATDYTITLSGEDLPGEQTQQLTLSLVGEVVASLAGDFNADGIVDAGDYTLYRDTFGSTTELDADADGSGEIDAADLAIWQANFGATAPGAVTTPEPAGWLLAALAYGYASTASRRR